MQKTWRRGRSGICNGEKSKRFTFQLCPTVHKELLNYCGNKGLLKSVVINEAIQSYIQTNKGE